MDIDTEVISVDEVMYQVPEGYCLCVEETGEHMIYSMTGLACSVMSLGSRVAILGASGRVNLRRAHA